MKQYEINITDHFISDLYELSLCKVPENIAHQASKCLIDYIGASYAGSYIAKAKISKLAQELGCGLGALPVIGTEIKTNLISSALLNGIISHTAELDDGVISGIVHPGSPIFSALLPYAIHNKIDGINFIIGIVIAYEACVRLSEAIQPSHKLLGYHATSTCGSIGAAIGAVIMKNGKKSDIKNAFSAAVITSGGTLKALQDKSDMKSYNAGNAAVLAINAASLANAGFSGPDDVLDSNFGFFDMFSDTFDINKLFSAKRSEKYAITKVYFKPYAACRYCHAPIDAAKKILETHTIDFNNIKRIDIKTYDLAVKGHDHKEATSISSAKMSIPFSISQLFVCGDLGPLGFTKEHLQNSQIIKLSRLVNVMADNVFTKAFPKKSKASVKIITKDNTYINSVDYPSGEPELPLSDKEIEEKFMILGVNNLQDKRKLELILKTSRNLPSSIYDLYELL